MVELALAPLSIEVIIRSECVEDLLLMVPFDKLRIN